MWKLEFWRETALVILAFILAGVLVWHCFAESSKPTPADKTDTSFIQLRYDTSEDLVESLEGFRLYQTYPIRCNDGVTRMVKVALLDRKLRRAGIIIVTSSRAVGGNVGGRSYDPRGVAFVEIDWLKERLGDSND